MVQWDGTSPAVLDLGQDLQQKKKVRPKKLELIKAAEQKILNLRKTAGQKEARKLRKVAGQKKLELRKIAGQKKSELWEVAKQKKSELRKTTGPKKSTELGEAAGQNLTLEVELQEKTEAEKSMHKVYRAMENCNLVLEEKAPLDSPRNVEIREPRTNMRSNMFMSSEYHMVYIHLETFRSTKSSSLHLLQLGAISPAAKTHNDFFRAIKPSVLDM